MKLTAALSASRSTLLLGLRSARGCPVAAVIPQDIRIAFNLANRSVAGVSPRLRHLQPSATRGSRACSVHVRGVCRRWFASWALHSRVALMSGRSMTAMCALDSYGRDHASSHHWECRRMLSGRSRSIRICFAQGAARRTPSPHSHEEELVILGTVLFSGVDPAGAFTSSTSCQPPGWTVDRRAEPIMSAAPKIDIEHVTVHDDPRQWSSGRKVCVVRLGDFLLAADVMRTDRDSPHCLIRVAHHDNRGWDIQP